MFRKKLIAGVTIAAFVFSMFQINTALAASIVVLSDTMEDQSASAESNHTIVFTLSASGAMDNDDTLTLTFPAGFDLTSIIEDDVDISGSTTGELTTAANCASTEEMSVAVSGQTIVFTICNGDGGDLVNSETITIEIGDNATASGTGVNKIVNHATPGSYSVSIETEANGSTTIDTGSFAIPIIDDGNVTITATVDPFITFDLDTGASTGSASSAPYSVALGTLTSGAVATTGVSSVNYIGVDIDTNANGGAVVYVSSANAALLDTATSAEITSGTATLAAGTEGYGVCVNTATAGTGTFQAVAPYASTCNTTTHNVGALQATNQPLLNSAGDPVAIGRAEVMVKAAISSVTPAGSYSDTLTFTAVGTF